MIDRYAAAVEHSNSMNGILSPEEILGVWERHPEFAPCGAFYGESEDYYFEGASLFEMACLMTAGAILTYLIFR